MINVNVLGWTTTENNLDFNKPFVHNRNFLICKYDRLLPFQIPIPKLLSEPNPATYLTLTAINVDTGVSTDITAGAVSLGGLDIINHDYRTVIYYDGGQVATPIGTGLYRFTLDVNGTMYYSQMVNLVEDVSPYTKIEWWDNDDFYYDSNRGVIIYTKKPVYKNLLYLNVDIGRPNIDYDEEVEVRDLEIFPIKQLSDAKYQFEFIAPEWLVFVVRMIRLHDNVVISYRGNIYETHSFVSEFEWLGAGDLAKVECEFQWGQIVKKTSNYGVSGGAGSFDNSFDDSFN